MAVIGGSGSSNTSVWQTELITATQNFSPPYNCTAFVHVIGGGGGGGACEVEGQVGEDGLASAAGGGAAGLSSSLLTLDPSVTYTATIGAGGDGGYVNDNAPIAARDNGDAGGNSTFAGTGIATMTSTGGGGGIATMSTSGSTSSAGGSGSGASGGTVMNITGGSGGAAASTYTGSQEAVCTGGGAVGINGIGYNGGAASGNIQGSATGGGGTGGHGAAATNSSVLSVGGGGFESGSANQVSSGENLFSHTSAILLDRLLATTTSTIFGICKSNTLAGKLAKPPGSGGGASDFESNGGWFAGGGAGNGATASKAAGHGGYGAGGGGRGIFPGHWQTARKAWGGNGGNGIIIIEIVEVLKL